MASRGSRVEQMLKDFVSQPFLDKQINSVRVLLQTQNLNTQQVNTIFQHVKKTHQLTPQIYDYYLSGLARRQDLTALKKGIEKAKQDGQHSPHNWSHIYLQYHATRRNEQECLSLLSSLLSSHISSLSIHDFIFVMKHLGKNKEMLEKLENIWKELKERGFIANSYVSTTFAALYAQIGDMESAVSWLGEIWNAGDKPTIETYNIILHGYATLNDEEGVEEYYKLLKTEGVVPNRNTFFGILSGFSASGNQSAVDKWTEEKARELQEKETENRDDRERKKERVRTPEEEEKERITNNIVGEITNNRENVKQGVGKFMKITDEKGLLLTDLESFNKLLGGLAQQGDYKTVQDLMKKMRQREMKLDAVSYNSWILVNEQKGNMDMAEEIVETIMKKDGIKATVATYTIMIRGFAKINNFEKVNKWLGIMKDNGVKPNTITYNTIIFELTRKEKEKEEATKWLARMKREKVDRNVVTYINFIYKASREKNFKDIEYWMEEIKREGLQANELVFKYIFDATTKEEEIQEWYNRMKIMGIKQTIITYNTIIKSLVTEEDMMGVQQWYTKMREDKIKPDTQTMNCLIEKLARDNNHTNNNNSNNTTIKKKKGGGMIKYWYGILKAEGVQPNSRTFYALFSAISQNEEIESITYWLSAAKESGVVISAEMARVLVGGFVRRGMGEAFRNFVESKIEVGKVDPVFRLLLAEVDDALNKL